MKESKKRERLDLLLMKRFPGITRARARSEIMSGRVLVEGRVCPKPGVHYPGDAKIELRERECSYVSRGGIKLAGALRDLDLTVKGLSVIDVGASTGGFTDCLLQQGARRVISLDVGYGQLDWKLRQHRRVTVLERCNIRYLQPGDLPWVPELAVADLSFISLKLVLPALKENKIPAVLALVKPQFEVGRREAGRGKGVVSDPGLHREVLLELAGFACKTGYCTAALSYSRLRGPKGNREYFVYWKRRQGECTCPGGLKEEISRVVERAHREPVK